MLRCRSMAIPRAWSDGHGRAPVEADRCALDAGGVERRIEPAAGPDGVVRPAVRER